MNWLYISGEKRKNACVTVKIVFFGHEWDDLPMIFTSDPKIVIHGNECIILFLTRYFIFPTHNSTKNNYGSLISPLSLRRSFVSYHCDVTTIDLWRHANEGYWHCDVIFVDCFCTRTLAQSRSSLVTNSREYWFLTPRYSRPSFLECTIILPVLTYAAVCFHYNYAVYVVCKKSVRYGLNVVFVHLQITYHNHTDLWVSFEYLKCLWGIFCRVHVHISNYLLCNIWGCMFLAGSFPFFVNAKTCVLHLSIVTKSEIWIISHCLWFAVRVSVFSYLIVSA